MFFYCFLYDVNSSLLSILTQLDMKNPIVIGRNSDIKNKEMHNLMKDVMKLNQTIAFTNLRNISVQKNTGIIFQSDEYTFDELFDQKRNAIIQKPWIIVKKELKKYSRIDEPLYVLDNGTLYEHYELKSLRISNILGKKLDNKLIWAADMPKMFFDRRGNFHGQTLFSMVEFYPPDNKLKKQFNGMPNFSDTIPNTYEVS